jgi:hypothetical protein
MLSLRRLLLVLAIAVAVAVAAVPAASPASAQGHNAEYSEFYQALEPFGRWFEHPRWGLVWWPYAQQEEDWRPYSRGQWVYTEDHGWYWDSDEEWGWATYHYGRWVFDERYGWLWVPGHEWAPAWVAWRESDEYVGWAPLAPDAIWEPDYGVRYSYAEYEAPYWAPIWCFVYPRYLLAPRVWHHFAPRSRNVYLLGRTRHATRYSMVGGRIFNRGLDVRHIARITHQSIPALQVRTFNSARDFARRRGEREFVGIYRPQLSSAPQGQRSAPRLTAPDTIESARRTRTTLRAFGPGDQPERDRSLRSAPSFKERAPGSSDLRSDRPPSVISPRNGPAPDDNRRFRERSVGQPPVANIPSPQPPPSGDAARSLRSRTWDRPPSANVVPSPPPSGDVGRSFRDRSRGTSDGPAPSGSLSRRVFQPQTTVPAPAAQSPPLNQGQAATLRQAPTQNNQSRGGQHDDRKRKGQNEGQPPSVIGR